MIKIKNNKKKLDYPKWKTLININIDQLTNQNKLIYNLYVLMPPRRIKDYINFVYVSNINNIIDQNNNYCFIDYENLNNSKFIFYNYKTFKTYGIQKLIISDDLLNFIIEYVKNQNIKDNEKLIKINSNTRFIEALNKIFGYSVDIIRHSFIDYLYTLNLSYSELDKISFYMAHNIKQQQKYKKMIDI